jgi:hypothetical protein
VVVVVRVHKDLQEQQVVRKVRKEHKVRQVLQDP